MEKESANEQRAKKNWTKYQPYWIKQKNKLYTT